MSVKEKVIQSLVSHLGIEESKVTDNSNFINDLNMDSLDLVEIIIQTEEEFGISISDGEAEKLKTVDELVKFVESKIAK